MAELGGGGDGARRGRLVVVGDADFASDAYLDLLGNRDLALNAVAWLAGEEALGGRAAEADVPEIMRPLSPLVLTEPQARAIFLGARRRRSRRSCCVAGLVVVGLAGAAGLSAATDARRSPALVGARRGCSRADPSARRAGAGPARGARPPRVRAAARRGARGRDRRWERRRRLRAARGAAAGRSTAARRAPGGGRALDDLVDTLARLRAIDVVPAARRRPPSASTQPRGTIVVGDGARPRESRSSSAAFNAARQRLLRRGATATPTRSLQVGDAARSRRVDARRSIASAIAPGERPARAVSAPEIG